LLEETVTVYDSNGVSADGRVVTSVEGEGAIDHVVGLLGNYPNPFNPQTTISFSLNEPTNISLTVYDILGREITVLAHGPLGAGKHTAIFEAGHAAMSRPLGKPVSEVSIIKGEDFNGYVLHKGTGANPEITVDLRARIEMEKLTMISMAGEAAECILMARRNRAGYWQGGSSSDRSNIVDNLSYLCRRDSDIGHYFILLWGHTIDVMKMEWWNVDHIARRLLEVKKMSGDDIDNYLESFKHLSFSERQPWLDNWSTNLSI